MTDFIYDIEVYPNVFTLTLLNVSTEEDRVYEVSHRCNDFRKLAKDIRILGKRNARMIGFNNTGYDYPVLHTLLHRLNSGATAEEITNTAFKKSANIFETDHSNRFVHLVWDSAQIVPQVDLFKIHHFDNIARATSLKALEFNMRSIDIRSLPFEPGKFLTDDEIEQLIEYNRHDVTQTFRFYRKSRELIRFREELSEKYGCNFLNNNDTKIGKDYFVMRLENALGEKACYVKKEGKRQPRQTIRRCIKLSDVLLPYIQFKRPELQAVINWIKGQVIQHTKGTFACLDVESLGELANHCDHKSVKGKIKNLNTVVDGFRFDFGTGGIHGSIPSSTVYSDDEYVICDLDVTSYYPSLAISNRIYPEHLGPIFCEIYADMKHRRSQYKKGTAENTMLKLALNGVFGASNNIYSPFFDPQYTMSITINGQLLLCMLSEFLMEIGGLRMIQANTDGITVILPRARLDELKNKCLIWELDTGLDLEYACYSRMFIRDVNNYIAEYEDGGLKRKGAYEYQLDWSKNHSSLVVQKAVEARLIKNIDITDFITGHQDIFDFFLRTKVPRTSRLVYRTASGDIQIENITRYYISTNGGSLIKIMPPLKGKNTERETGINKGWLVTPCNHVDFTTLADLDYRFYIEEAEKMVRPVMNRFECQSYGK